MSFQTVVNKQQAPAVGGDFASVNPYSTMTAGEGAIIVGDGGVSIGKFAFVDKNGIATQTKPQDYRRLGFVANEQQASIVEYLAEYGLTIQKGQQVTLYTQGDFYASFEDGAVASARIYIENSTGKIIADGGQSFNPNNHTATDFYVISNAGANELTVITSTKQNAGYVE